MASNTPPVPWLNPTARDLVQEEDTRRNSTMGIVGFILAMCGPVTAVPGLILGIIAWSRAEADGMKKTLAVWATFLSAAMIVLVVAAVIVAARADTASFSTTPVTDHINYCESAYNLDTLTWPSECNDIYGEPYTP